MSPPSDGAPFFTVILLPGFYPKKGEKEKLTAYHHKTFKEVWRKLELGCSQHMRIVKRMRIRIKIGKEVMLGYSQQKANSKKSDTSSSNTPLKTHCRKNQPIWQTYARRLKVRTA